MNPPGVKKDHSIESEVLPQRSSASAVDVLQICPK